VYVYGHGHGHGHGHEKCYRWSVGASSMRGI
jgi:hypothetical protein